MEWNGSFIHIPAGTQSISSTANGHLWRHCRLEFPTEGSDGLPTPNRLPHRRTTFCCCLTCRSSSSPGAHANWPLSSVTNITSPTHLVEIMPVLWNQWSYADSLSRLPFMPSGEYSPSTARCCRWARAWYVIVHQMSLSASVACIWNAYHSLCWRRPLWILSWDAPGWLNIILTSTGPPAKF